MDLIDAVFSRLGERVGELITNPFLQSLVKDGIVAGVGGVVIFLPQILIVLFSFR